MKDSVTSVKEGVSDVSALNPRLSEIILKNKKPGLTHKDFVNGILSGDRVTLSKAITLVESNRRDHQDLSQEVLESLLPYIGNSIRIGITGVPGVGKSTFIEVFGEEIIRQGRNIAVLAIDPTSQRSHGSILGDKTRMESLSANPRAYIRPSPAGGSLGGVARKTRESIFLCEAAGFNTILVETVGVGQSETSVHSMVDFFLLLMLAGAGDELQGIKRGIMEMADMIAINKADGDNLQKAIGAKSEYQSALHLFPPTSSGWIPQVVTCSSIERIGVPDIWKLIIDFLDLTKKNGYQEANRKNQTRYWFKEFLSEAIQENFYEFPGRREKTIQLEEKVIRGEISSLTAIRELFG